MGNKSIWIRTLTKKGASHVVRVTGVGLEREGEEIVWDENNKI